MTVTLRPIVDEDEAFLRRLYATTREMELSQIPWDDQQKLAFVTHQFLAQRHHYQSHYPQASYDLILLDGQPIGRLYVLRDGEEMRILDLSMMPEFRNRGIGTQMIQKVMAEAEANNSRLRIYLETFNPSVLLFERLGFRVIQNDDMNLLLEWQP